ncbi:conserved hypothetical protein [Methylomarinovum tepidoasis]|uniref:PIN domain-containing protein n=2 Tax=Methylomarinovum tepidoasis TaxID=2840183 RepID=A0AAU9D1Q4_9GAMM|nr:conserved hypothetical protein [Methylomarinovum sp. IN45]
MIRAVVDTSVIVAALLGPKGASRAVLRACLQRTLTPLMGTALFLEYESLLQREEVFAACPLEPGEREALIDAFLSVCEWVDVYYLWRPNLVDEADNHVLELAVAGQAEVIVTKNSRDFRGELRFPELSLSIMTPDAFLLDRLR